ncbi:MAG: PulJ/GspJ family protein, partial [Spirochaetota bacterium]
MHRTNSKHSQQSGFSLLEVLVAATVSSIILMMIYTAHRSIMFSVRDMAGIAEFYENVNLASRRIDRDLQCTLTVDDNKRL